MFLVTLVTNVTLVKIVTLVKEYYIKDVTFVKILYNYINICSHTTSCGVIRDRDDHVTLDVIM